MSTYLVPTVLYVVAIVFGVVWIWLCGGFEKYEVRQRKYVLVLKPCSIGATTLALESCGWDIKEDSDGNKYAERGGQVLEKGN